MPAKFRRYTLFAIPLLALVVVDVMLGFNGLYGQDPHYYFQYSQALTANFAGGESPAMDFFWPVLYPISGAVPSLLGVSQAFWLQLVSCLSIGFAALYSYKILAVFYPDKEKRIYWYVLLGLVASPYLLRSSVVVMSDALCVALIVAALYHVLQYGRLLKAKHLIFASICIGSAVMTRYVAAVILLVPGIYLAISIVKNKKWIHFLYGALFLAACVVPHILLKGENTARFLTHGVFGEWSLFNVFSRDFVTSEGQLHYTFPNIVYGMFNFVHPGYFVLGLPVLVFLRKRHFMKREQLMLCLALAIYLIFAIGIPNQNTRFLLVSFPLAALILFPAYDALLNKLEQLKSLRLLLAGVVALVQIALFVYVFKPFYDAQQLEKNIAFTLDHYEADRTVYTFAMNLALQSYDISQDIESLYDSEIDNFDVGSVVLFAPERFAEQWADQNPMRNWELLNNDYEIKQLEEFEQGWKLYEIVGKK